MIDLEKMTQAYANVEGCGDPTGTGGRINVPNWVMPRVADIIREYDRLVARDKPCYMYWGSDMTLCAQHHGRFADKDVMCCDRRYR